LNLNESDSEDGGDDDKAAFDFEQQTKMVDVRKKALNNYSSPRLGKRSKTLHNKTPQGKRRLQSRCLDLVKKHEGTLAKGQN
jgi:hypothetical protein